MPLDCSAAVQPVHAQTIGLGFQVVGRARRTVEQTAETVDRLQPRLGGDSRPIQDRAQRGWIQTMGPGMQLTTCPVQQRQVALQRYRQQPQSLARREPPELILFVADAAACGVAIAVVSGSARSYSSGTRFGITSLLSSGYFLFDPETPV